ncbi:MFS transporter [Nonomuraea sp. NPDC050643]|uniref:MFS transporter n=1 Tax=Nonomuraea sp. NPDC050643 TaxID=3155660 RepID=UPI0034041EF0
MKGFVVAADREMASRGFYWLWGAQTVSMVGSITTAFALPLIAALVLNASPWSMGILAAAAEASVLVFGLSIGVWADRFEHLRLMHMANVARFVLVLCVPILYVLDHLNMAILIAITFLVGALSMLYDAAVGAFLPRLLGGRGLAKANSWNEASESTGDVAGPGFAGLLVQIAGAPMAMLLDAVSYVVSSVLLTRLPAVPPKEDDRKDDEKGHLAAVRSGLRALRRFPYQLPLLLASTQFNFFGSMFGAVIILFCVRDLGMNAGTLGALAMLGGVAGLIAAWMGQRLTAKLGLGRTLILCYFAPAVTALPIGFMGEAPFPLAIAAIALSQFFWPFWIVIMRVNSVTLRQTVVPNRYLARVGTCMGFFSTGIMTIGALIGGALGSSPLGMGGTIILSSVGLGTAAVWLWYSSVRELEVMPAADMAAEPA